MQLCGVHTMNLHEVSSTLYNIGRIQQKAERGKGQIRELNKSTQQETDRGNLLSNLLLEKSLSLRSKQDANLIQFSSIP